MKPVNKDILKLAADKIMLELDEEEYDSLVNELKDIVLSMEEMARIPGIDDVEPMTFPFNVTTETLREDIPEKPLSKEEALKNARDVSDGQIRLPKVVG